MAMEQFKPTLWSRRVIVNVDKSLVYGKVADQSYEGEISYGNILKINEIGDISVSDYTSTITYSALDDAQLELVIDAKKYFAFKLDDVDKAQANVTLMDKAMVKASHAVRDTIDQALAAKYGDAAVTNTTNLGSSGASRTVYSKEAIDVLTYMHRYLDEENAPREGRWVILPPWMIQYLVFSRVISVGANMDGGGYANEPNSPVLRNGMVGDFLGFRIYMSNNVSTSSTQYRVMFGMPDALAYAGQVAKVEAVRLEDYFSDAIRGLYVYGIKVVRPNRLGCAYLAAGGLTT